MSRKDCLYLLLRGTEARDLEQEKSFLFILFILLMLIDDVKRLSEDNMHKSWEMQPAI